MRDLDDYALKYKNQPYERFQVHFRKQKVREILQRYKHHTLLEIGCGLAPAYMDIDSYEQLYIIEPAHIFYTGAVKMLAGHKRQSDVFILNKTAEDAATELSKVHFDFILLSALLNEVKDTSALLQAVRQIAGPDTTVHINVPNAKSFHRLLAVEMGLIKNEFEFSNSNVQFQQHAVFDRESLTALVEKNGFRILERGTYSFKPFTHQQMEAMMQQGLLTEEILQGFYKMEKYLPNLGSEIYVNAVKK